MIKFKIHIERNNKDKIKAVRLVTPDGHAHECVPNPTIYHEWSVEVLPSSFTVPSDASVRMQNMMEHIEKRWLGTNMYQFVKFLAESKEIRMVYLRDLFPTVFPSVAARRQLLNYMTQMGGLQRSFMGGFKRSEALNDWLLVSYDKYSMGEPVSSAPAVALDQVQKVKDKEKKRKLTMGDLQEMTVAELTEFIDENKSRMKKKDLHRATELLRQKRLEAIQASGENAGEYTPKDRRK